MKTYYVYIATNTSRTLYIGVTNNLERRMYEHTHHLVPGFTAQYNITKLAYFESTVDINSAITREKELKGWLRAKKIKLIESINPKWEDLVARSFVPAELRMTVNEGMARSKAVF